MTGELAITPILSAKSYWNKPLYIHSDMGNQFTSFAFESTLEKLDIKHSYSRIGKPGDNARIESFHSLIKRELINNKEYQSYDEIQADIGWYMNFYNKGRLNSR